MFQKKFFILGSLIVIIYSCTNVDSNRIKPLPAGAPGDVVVVMNEPFWEAAPGDSLLSILTTPFEPLPREEPMFNVIHVVHSGFGKIIKQQRNIIITKIGKDQAEAKILVKRDLWAQTQLLISVLAPTKEEFLSLIEANRNKILALIDEVERQRLMDVYKKSHDENIMKTLENKFHIKLFVPKGYKIDVNEDEFIWLSMEYRDIIQGVFVYTYDYTDKNTFTRDYLIEKRNKFLMRFVPGEIEGSYMITEPLFPPMLSELNLNNKFTLELQGLWRMQEGYAMGGPFMSLTQLDENRNKIITVEGFVFAPAHKKRELMRQMEAILYSIKIPEQKLTD
jgi:hypothetical protein